MLGKQQNISTPKVGFIFKLSEQEILSLIGGEEHQ